MRCIVAQSPWVARRNPPVARVEPTLGNSIRADRVFAAAKPGALAESMQARLPMRKEVECLDCRGTFRVMDIVPFKGRGGGDACPWCGGLL